MGDNPNTFTFITEWIEIYQTLWYKNPVFRALAEEGLATKLKKGQTVKRTYSDDDEFIVKDMGADGSYETQPTTDIDESLIINNEKEVSFYIKELDEFQSHLPIRQQKGKGAMKALFLKIDGDILGTYDQAYRNTDNEDFGGSDGDGVTVTVDNIDQIFIMNYTKLVRANVIDPNSGTFTGNFLADRRKRMPVATISSQFHQVLLERLAAKETDLGDKVALNGHSGRYMNFDLFVTNNSAWSGRLEFGTNPSEDDTITVNGLTYRFKGTPAAAGDIDIKGSAALTLDELVLSINAPFTARSGDYIAQTDNKANRKLAENIVATDWATYMTIKATGKDYLPVSETLTAPADIWTAAKQIQHLIFGVKGCVSLIIQKTPKMKDREPPAAKIGRDFIFWGVYGYKVFRDQTFMMIDTRIRSDAYVG